MHPVSVSFNETLAAVSQRGLGAGESIGEYWKPVFTLLEGTLQVLLVNAAHMMADLAKGRRSTLPQLKQDLTGLVGDHQRSLATQLVHIDFLEEQIDNLGGTELLVAAWAGITAGNDESTGKH
jgi:hypothetical protein